MNEGGAEWKTALMHAAAKGWRDICELLLAHGADPARRDLFGRTAVHWAEAGGNPNLALFLRGMEA